jgi:predicted acyl esterase
VSSCGLARAYQAPADDGRSLVFESPPLEASIEILGAPIVTLDVASDRPMANLVVRLCDVHPSGESLRVSYGVLNLAHHDGHERPALMAAGEHYRVRVEKPTTFRRGDMRIERIDRWSGIGHTECILVSRR